MKENVCSKCSARLLCINLGSGICVMSNSDSVYTRLAIKDVRFDPEGFVHATSNPPAPLGSDQVGYHKEHIGNRRKGSQKTSS
jgi:hypothetical protein